MARFAGRRPPRGGWRGVRRLHRPPPTLSSYSRPQPSERACAWLAATFRDSGSVGARNAVQNHPALRARVGRASSSIRCARPPSVSLGPGTECSDRGQRWLIPDPGLPSASLPPTSHFPLIRASSLNEHVRLPLQYHAVQHAPAAPPAEHVPPWAQPVGRGLAADARPRPICLPLARLARHARLARLARLHARTSNLSLASSARAERGRTRCVRARGVANVLAAGPAAGRLGPLSHQRTRRWA